MRVANYGSQGCAVQRESGRVVFSASPPPPRCRSSLISALTIAKQFARRS